MATSRGVEWLAGLLEGEGCFIRQFGRARRYTPVIAVTMTDRDVIEAAQELFLTIGGRHIRIRSRYLASGKIAHELRISGLPAAKLMVAILPFMGKRRSQTIQNILDGWSPKVYRAAIAFKSELDRTQRTF